MSYTAEQCLAIRALAAATVRAALGAGAPPPTSCGDTSTDAVAGVFVSLYHGEHLRACRGTTGGGQLASSVARAASAAATDDTRFEPIMADELPALQLEIHVLHDWEAVPGPASERASKLAVPGHGLMLRGRGHTGLLLPAVARKHGFDAVNLLRHTCRKAGLDDEAWQDEQVAAYRFRATEISGPLNQLT